MDKEKLEYGYRRALCLFDGGDVDLTTFAGIAIARTALLNAARVRRLKTADVSLCREILKDASLDLSVVTLAAQPETRLLQKTTHWEAREKTKLRLRFK